MHEIEDLKNYVLKFRFTELVPEVFDVYAKLEKLCIETKDFTNLVFTYFYLGEAYYRQGKDNEAVTAINKCLSYIGSIITIDDETKLIEVRCHNLLGLMFYAKGTELTAFDYYIKGLDIALKYHIYSYGSIININIGNLFRDLDSPNDALIYYNRALDIVNEHPTDFNDYELKTIISAYQGIIFFELGNLDDGIAQFKHVEQLEKLEPCTFYNEATESLRIYCYHFTNQMDLLNNTFDKLNKSLLNNNDFSELCMIYVKIAEFLFKHDYKDQLRITIDGMASNATRLDNIFVKIKIQELEANYQQKYGTNEEYLIACQAFHIMSMSYNQIIRNMKTTGILNLRDLNLARKHQAHLIDVSERDSMTYLLNKQTTRNRIQEKLDDQSCNESALILIDLDDFKSINDTYGHLTGDKVICAVVEEINKIFHYAEIKGRIGGDEFVIFLNEIYDIQACINIVETLTQKVASLQENKVVEPYISLSVGIAFTKNRTTNYDTLFSEADHALYKAKSCGKSCFMYNS